MPMNLKTRKYYQLVATLAEKRRRQASENLKLVGNLPSQLGAPQNSAGSKPDPELVIKSEDEVVRHQLERAEMMSPLEALRAAEDESSVGGWVPFQPRSKL